jgi:hypothetical protein
MIEFLVKYGKELPHKYVKVLRGAKNPIHIVHPQAKRKKLFPLQYEPDVYFIKKNKNKIIFEVLDSELRNTSEIIADVIQCCLCGNVDLVVFVLPTDEEEVIDGIFDICEILADTLVNLGVNKKMIPEFAVYFILRSEARSYKRVKRILTNLSRTDKW